MEKSNLREHVSGTPSLVNWKSIFAGLFVAVIVNLLLTALGVGIGGTSASSLIENNENARGLATGAAVWIAIAGLISLAAGGYFAARTSHFITARVGAVQGVVIAAIFFTFMIYGAGVTIGAAGKGLSSVAGAVGAGVGDVASSPEVQNVVQKALGDSALKSDPATVVQGLVVRLLRGDVQGTKTYFAYQTGLDAAEVDTRMASLQQEFNETLRTIGTKAANAASAAGWTLFTTLLLGVAAAAFGGAMGSRVNLKRPLSDQQSTPFITRSAA